MKALTGVIVLSLGLGLQSIRAGEATNVVRYVAQPTGSNVKIEGTSTIHDWTMESALIGGSMETQPGFPESATTNALAAKPTVQIVMLVRSLKSSSTRMDEVMQEHMNVATFPKIEYKLIELKPKSGLQFDAVGVLTINGTTKTNIMPVTFEHMDGTKLKVSGSAPLKMTDFGVKPPAPNILGMAPIKTGDDIKIIFEWMTAPRKQK